MAALDFPASPSVDQTYGAPNGITYKWTGTVWVAIGGSTPPPAGYAWDARATSTATNMASGVWTKLPFNLIAVEQGGTKFDIALNRVMPPAGLYSVTVQMRLNGSGVAAWMAIQLYKNGAPMTPPVIPTPIATAFANKYHSVSATWLVQANGSDYIEAWGMQTADNAGVFTLDGPDCLFTGFAVSGVKGAPGEPYPGTVGGDFYATKTGGAGIDTTVKVRLFDTIVSGNSGNWYNPANGRFTPPAGRYHVFAQAGFYSSSAGIGCEVVIRKNGVSAIYAYTSAGIGFSTSTEAQGLLDANGTDYFDVTVRSSGPTPSDAYEPQTFSAFSISGVKGPPGDPGPAGSIPTGDFMSTFAGSLAATTTPTAVLLTNIVTGNSGTWYNPATGRYTPPAGRYAINGSCSLMAGLSQSVGVLGIYKNGALVFENRAVCPVSNPESITVDAMLDANGTDYFDLRYSVPSGAQTLTAASFMAYPSAGTKGPQGDAGSPGFRLLQRTVISASVPDVTIQNIPADINSLRFECDLTPSVNAQDLVLQFYNSVGALVSAASSYTSSADGSNHIITTGAASFAIGSATAGTSNGILMTYSVATRRVSSTFGIRASGSIPNIRVAGREKSVHFQTDYVSDDGQIVLVMTGGGRWGLTPGQITGLRFVFGSGNIASGAFSVWGSP